MAKSLVVTMLVVVMLFVGVVSPAMADGGGDDEGLVELLLGVRDGGNSLNTAIDKFRVPFCKKSFLTFISTGVDTPSYCTVDVARLFIGGQLDKNGNYTVPRGWTKAQFISFARWIAKQ